MQNAHKIRYRGANSWPEYYKSGVEWMWDFEPTEEFARRSKRFVKNHPRELQAVLLNLSRVQRALQEGTNPQKIPFGFIHPEQRGVVAIDQRGGGKNLAEVRLYVYLDAETETIHQITLGDKRSQNADIKFSAEFVESLRQQKEKGESNA
jgi:hypothetical protein